MDARTGDRLIIDGHRVGTKPREGEVVDASGATLTIRWQDGHESVFVPGSDCRIARSDRRKETSDRPEQFGAHIEVHALEDPDWCQVEATMVTNRGTFQATGTARRHPDDPSIPLVGEELATGRALQALAEELLNAAQDTIRAGASSEEHLLS